MRISPRVQGSLDEAQQEEHEGSGFDVLPYDKRWSNYRLRLKADDFDQRAEALVKLAKHAELFYRARTGD